MARSSAAANRRPLLAALVAILVACACQRTTVTSVADAAPPQPPRSPDAAPSSADIVSKASDAPAPAPAPAPHAGADASSDAGPVAPDPHARTLTMAKPFWGGDGARDAPVFVARGDDPALLVRRALDDLDVHVPKHRRVIIKINLGGFDRMKPGKPDDGVAGRTTSPAFVRALIIELRSRGVTDLAIADGRSAPADEWPALLALSGYQAILDELDVPFVDLGHYGKAAGDTRPEPWRLKLPWAHSLKDELVLSSDLIDPAPARRPYLIDVPKLKAHRFAVMSLSIKNLMGAVMIASDASATSAPPWRRRWRMHRELSPWLDAWKKTKHDDRALYRAALVAFSERLADLYGALTPDLVLIEGLPAAAGDGFAAIVPYPSAAPGQGIVIASRNGCYADWVAARFFGLADSDALERELGVRLPPAILAVAERYYGGLAGLAKVVVRGDPYLPSDGSPPAWFKSMAPFEIGSK